MNFRNLDPPSDPDQDPDPDQEFWLSIWWGNRGADFWISFFRKIYFRGVLTLWPWCDFLTLVSRLPAFSWPVLPLGVHRTPAAGELSPAELWWPMQAKSTFQSCSLLSTLHYVLTLVLLLGIFCPRVVKHSVCLLCFHPLRCHYSCWPKILVLFSPIRFSQTQCWLMLTKIVVCRMWFFMLYWLHASCTGLIVSCTHHLLLFLRLKLNDDG